MAHRDQLTFHLLKWKMKARLSSAKELSNAHVIKNGGRGVAGGSERIENASKEMSSHERCFQSDDTLEQVSEETLDTEIVLANISLNEYFELKPGICLQRSNEEWTVAKEYFKYLFTINPMDLSSIDQSIQSMNQAIYNYFRDTC